MSYYSSYSLVTHQRNFKNGENCSLTYIKERKRRGEGREKVPCLAKSSNEQKNHVSKKKSEERKQEETIISDGGRKYNMSCT